jgi:hypothetical protein
LNDSTEVGAVISNDSDVARDCIVVMGSSDNIIGSASSASSSLSMRAMLVAVPPQQRRMVRFPIVANNIGQASFMMAVSDQDRTTDVVIESIPGSFSFLFEDSCICVAEIKFD